MYYRFQYCGTDEVLSLMGGPRYPRYHIHLSNMFTCTQRRPLWSFQSRQPLIQSKCPQACLVRAPQGCSPGLASSSASNRQWREREREIGSYQSPGRPTEPNRPASGEHDRAEREGKRVISFLQYICTINWGPRSEYVL